MNYVLPKSFSVSANLVVVLTVTLIILAGCRTVDLEIPISATSYFALPGNPDISEVLGPTESSQSIGAFVSHWLKINPRSDSGEISIGGRKFVVRFVADRPGTFLPSYFDSLSLSRLQKVRKLAAADCKTRKCDLGFGVYPTA